MQRIIYLAGGCFWGLEAYFKRISGIITTSVGYSNGHYANPSYEEVCRGSGHVETVKVTYDDATISLSQSFNIFCALSILLVSINKVLIQASNIAVASIMNVQRTRFLLKVLWPLPTRTIVNRLLLKYCPSIPFTLLRTITKTIWTKIPVDTVISI